MIFTVVHLFAGAGGCTLGFKRAGFKSLGSFDFDPKAIRNLVRLTGSPGFVRDLRNVQPAELRELTGGGCPDVVVMSPPCKSFSGCMPAARASEAHYVDMSQLAVRGLFLALEAWAPAVPSVILLENVPRIQTRGATLLAQAVALGQRYGFSVDIDDHCCGEIGGLAQRRRRCLVAFRHMEQCPDLLRKPPKQRVRSVGEVLGVLPSPASPHDEELHRLPLLSAMNWVRLAAIRAGKDWRDLPAAIRIGGEAPARHDGKLGVEAWDAAAHTVIGRGNRPGSSWSSTADPRVGWDPEAHKGRPDSYGVGDWSAASLTVRARQDVQSSRASIADPRLAERAARQNGPWGVEAFDTSSHAVLGHANVRNTWASLADPRLGCEPRNGHYGVLKSDEPSGVILGAHGHDSGRGSVADPRLSYRSAERVAQADRREAGRGHSGRGDFGVMDPAAPAPTIRARHDVRQAPAAVVDERGWPLPTHHLVREGDELVLYGPPIDLESKRPCLLVIRAPDGTWHRPLTDRELAVLQGFPVDCYLEGPTASSKKAAGRREHIGNAIPPPTAEAIAREVMATLLASRAGGFRLAGGDVWVRQGEEAAQA